MIKKDDFIKQALQIIFATDDDKYPLPPHRKIARLQILADEYKKQNNIK